MVQMEWDSFIWMFVFDFISGTSMIDPKTSYHLNDIFEYPDRITISTESTDVLQSR